ncbi:MAG: class I SAM-dependent methyltransferase [Elusimicrobiota bacterium]|nr:class I SAM-dependent methyltransferase [Elusimicrobiota bacterium]
MTSQTSQREWNYLWTTLEDKDEWLFRAWIHPNTPESFAGKTVLDAGCGPGHHARLSAGYAKRVVGVDLNTAPIAKEKLKDLPNVEVVAGDIAKWDSGERFDVVYSVGVVHHTQNPDATSAHLKTLVKPGGRIIFWLYSREGNGFVYWVLEPLKKYFLDYLPRGVVMLLSHILTVIGSVLMHTFYRLPLPESFPYYTYCKNLRGSTYQRRLLNVFDKLNAPTTHLITEAQARSWVAGWKATHVDFYVGTSWRVSGTKPE